MTNQQSNENENSNEPNIRRTRLYSRLNSSILDLLPRQADRQSLHAAFIHSAAILFVLVCGACALLAYRILEPFLRSILWAILAGAFLFPCKHHLTSRARFYLKTIEENSRLLIFGVFVRLPIQTVDQTIESIGQFFWNKVKYPTVIIVFLVLNSCFPIQSTYIEFIKICHPIFIRLLNIFHFFESKWMIAVIILYILAVLTFYHHSWWMKTLLNIIAKPIGLFILIHLTQILPVTYRLPFVIFVIGLTILGLLVELKEYFEQSLARKSIINQINVMILFLF